MRERYRTYPDDTLCDNERQVYYRGIFFPRRVEVLDRELVRMHNLDGTISVFYRYLIKFKTGTLKIVEREKLF